MQNPSREQITDPSSWCLLDFKCSDKDCEFQEGCLILKRIIKICRNKYNQYNYGINHNHSHVKHGRASMFSLKRAYFNSLKSGFICPDCGKPMVFGGNEPDSATIDHIISRGKGGKNNAENLRLCCRDCNWERERQEHLLIKKKNLPPKSLSAPIIKKPEQTGWVVYVSSRY
jgi:5-methylcytosine-specific restriction endonuclease McrA